MATSPDVPRNMPNMSLAQSKKEYKKLIRAVRAINKEMARYLTRIAPSIPEFQYTNDLRDAFTWGWTKYDVEGWIDVYIELVKSGYYVTVGDVHVVFHTMGEK